MKCPIWTIISTIWCFFACVHKPFCMATTYAQNVHDISHCRSNGKLIIKIIQSTLFKLDQYDYVEKPSDILI